MTTPINKPVRTLGAALGIEAARRKALINTKAVFADVPPVTKVKGAQPLTYEQRVAQDKANVYKKLKD